MSDITVNVSIEDLKRFLSFISNFKRNIEEDCERLLVALKKLSVTMDSDSIFEINQSVNKIANILDINQDALFELYGKIEEYYLFIKKLQEVSDSQPSRPTVIPSQSVNHQPIYTASKTPSATTHTSSVPNAGFRFDTQKVNRVAYQLQQYKREIPIDVSSKYEAQSFIRYFKRQNGHLFHVRDINYTYMPSNNKAYLHPVYLYNTDEYKKYAHIMKQNADKIQEVVSIGKSQLEREKLVHDYLCRNVQHMDDSPECHTAIGPLIFKKGAYDGISRAAEILLKAAGIQSHIAEGEARLTGEIDFTPHMWNYVCIDSVWYHTDFTFDLRLSDKEIRYDYFNLSTDEITKDHILDYASNDISV